MSGNSGFDSNSKNTCAEPSGKREKSRVRFEPKWCRVVYNLFRPSSVSEEDFELNEGQYQKEVSIEDQKIVPLVQQNLETGIYQVGPLSPKYESGLAYFHQLLMARIGTGE